MKLGLIARADNSGLGIQTYEFFRNMHPDRTMVVDISKLNKNPVYNERYAHANTMHVRGFPNPGDIDKFLQGLDVVFIAESPYNYLLYEHARQYGVKTAVQYNYEFFDWFANPHYPKPDMLIAPSKWHYEDIDRWCQQHGLEHVYLHCPVNREMLPYRKITRARRFLHIAGRAAAHDRNGTDTVIEAAKYLRTDAFIYIHFQGEQGLGHQVTKTLEQYVEHVDRIGSKQVFLQQNEYSDYNQIYQDFDVLLMPRRYGGNCLPMNEALSCGMPVLMPDISPNNEFLPEQWLMYAKKIDEFEPRTKVDIYDVHPQMLAARIDDFYNLSEHAMYFYNVEADKLAQKISWKAMRSEYEKVLGGLCKR